MLNKIHAENCLDTMKRMPDDFVDLVVTSPPYNKEGLLGIKKNKGQIWHPNIEYDVYQDVMSEADYEQWIIEILNELKRIIKPNGSIFFNHKPRRHKNKAFLPTDFISKSELDLYQLIIWNRKNSPNIRNDIFIPCTEHIYWLVKGKPKTFRKNVDKEFLSEVWTLSADKQRNHPAPFPELIVENCINMASEFGDVVYDPFMGSGTTAVASFRLGRNFIGSEISNSYVEIAEKRLEDLGQIE
jgi:site-specific DNA-methyltransferase (adenine-specific)